MELEYPEEACSESETQRLSLNMGEASDPKSLGFHSVKPRNVGGRSTSSEGRAVLNQAVDESFVSGYELSCTKEGLCTTEDAQSATVFGGQMWLSQERSWQIVRSRSLNERTSSRGLFRK